MHKSTYDLTLLPSKIDGGGAELLFESSRSRTKFDSKAFTENLGKKLKIDVYYLQYTNNKVLLHGFSPGPSSIFPNFLERDPSTSTN